MTEPAAFAAALDLPEASVRRALADEAASAPWYVGAVAGIGGWLAALSLAAAIALFIADDWIVATVSGLVLIAVGAPLHRRRAGAFARQFALALILGGQAVILLGLHVELGLSAATAAATAMLALVPLLRDGAHQFVTVLVAAGHAVVLLAEREVPGIGALVVATTVPAASALLLLPPRGLDVRPGAVALVLAPVLGEALSDVVPWGWPWAARAAWLAVLCWPLAVAAREAGPEGRRLAAAAAVVALVAASALPSGLLAGLLLMVVGYVAGSRLLAGLGVAAEIGFMSRWYYELSLDLLAKSAMLAAVGAALLLLWLLWRRILPEADA